MTSTYFCCDEYRRNAVADHNTLNGIDFLEVMDDPAQPTAERQRTLFIHFLKENNINTLTRENIRIEGGERICDVHVAGDPQVDGTVLTVTVNKPGDFSIYTLRLVKKDDVRGQPPDGFDPILSSVDFSFKVNCCSEFDCKSKRICPPRPQVRPEIDYLAKDYGSFRQLMLDRMAAVIPDWKERNPADLGIALVEMLAYVGDHLSYRQDAVATESYLGTARRRISVRRHARLVDYFMHDGCNARAWVQIKVSKDVLKQQADQPPLPKGTTLLTSIPGQPVCLPVGSSMLRQAHAGFETMHDVDGLYIAHNEMYFYTWQDERCCLPKGATRATLRDDPNRRLRLRPGDVIILEERLAPNTGLEADADPTHRYAVRLTRVYPEAESVVQGQIEINRNPGPLVKDTLTGQAYVEIEWDEEDALPFPFCISGVTDKEHGQQYKEDMSFALGNVVLADHGLTISDEEIEIVQLKLFQSLPSGGDRCETLERKPIPSRFRPKLKGVPLTHAATVLKTQIINGRKKSKHLPFDPDASALGAFRWEMEAVLPAITLNNQTWVARRDLLNSSPDAKEFVVEIESDGSTCLRFGDDKYGKRPEAEMKFTATYRVGNGVAGNVGAETIAHIITNTEGIIAVRNPMPAQGGLDPENIEHVRQSAPYAFRTQERAVTPEDYAAVAERHPGVQRAAATFRWTGSWHTVFVTVDRVGGLEVDEDFKKEMRRHLERYRMAGHDVEVDGPRYVSLEIEVLVCVKPDYFRSKVKEALLEVFSNAVLPDGRRGIFHPDNFTFGQTVYLSPLYAAAQAVDGVASVQVTTFQRQGIDSNEALDAGKLILGRLEIARLDNDPNFPEHGVFRLDMKGGK